MLSHKMVSFRNFVLFFTAMTFCSGEIIKLENKTHILCITDKRDSAMYVDPPVIEESKSNSILIEGDGFWKDWVLKNSKDVIVPQVLDKRWENFETVYSDHVSFPSVVSLTYSRTSNFASISIHDPVSTNKRAKRQVKLTGWNHHTNHVSINETDLNHFSPIGIDITLRANSYWKIHDYNLRWAQRSSESTTLVPISPDDGPCVDLYIYLCSYCILSIRVGGHVFLLQGSFKKEWINRRFLVERATNMTLSRSTTRLAATEGQWAIDIRRCPPRKSKIINEVSLEKDVESGVYRTCKFLPAVHENVGHHTNIFKCDKGFFGRRCDISCEELLGSDLKYCQRHQICDNTLNNPECSCAWGYQGASCDEECASGNNGLSCNQLEEKK